MMKQSLVVLFFIFTKSFGFAAEAGPVDNVQRDAQRAVRALYAGDVETIMKITHPRVFEISGGKAAMRAGIEQAVARMQEAEMKIDSFKFPKSPEFFSGGAFEFAIVHTLTVISAASGQRAESLNFQLGVRDKGSQSWKFVEGSRMNAQSAQLLFPGFPADYKFPAVYRKEM